MPENEEQTKTIEVGKEVDEKGKLSAEVRKAYVGLEKAMVDGDFLYVVACRTINNGNQTSLIINRNISESASLKLLIQTSIIEALNAVTKELLNDFSKSKLTVGPIENFISKERLADIIGEHLQKLSASGAIIINDPSKIRPELKEDGEAAKQ